MKKTLLSLILVLCIMSLATLSVAAQPTDSTVIQINDACSVTYYEDGSYTVVSFPRIVFNSLQSEKIMAQLDYDAVFTTGAVDAINYSNKGDINWIYTLFGDFFYIEGVSCVCAGASYSTSIYGSGWYFYDGATSTSENAAYGTGTFKHKILFITNQTIWIDFRICCDNYGNFY